MGRTMSIDPKRLNHLAAVASMCVAATLICAKLAIWIVHRIGRHTGLAGRQRHRVIASIVTFISIRQAAQPPDRAHRYGHGKAEAIGAFVQAGFVLGSALFLAGEAVRRLISPQPIEQSPLGIAVLSTRDPADRRADRVSALCGPPHRLDRDPGRQPALPQRPAHEPGRDRGAAADRGDRLADGRSAVRPRRRARAPVQRLRVARHALDMLMDRELPAEQRPHIRTLALGHPKAHDVHDLRTRRAGSDVFIELHLELDGDLSLEQAHAITHEVEARIRAAFPLPTSSCTRSRPASPTSAWTRRSRPPSADTGSGAAG